MMRYEVKFSDKAKKSLRQIDHYQVKIILGWIEKNLEGCDNPRIHGKPPVGDKKGYWRYRVGTYRIIAEILDACVIIEIINVDHRRDIYN